MVDQPITNPISGPSFDFTFTVGPELDNFTIAWVSVVSFAREDGIFHKIYNCL